MNKGQLLHQIDKIFRANTVKSNIENGPFDGSSKDVIESIPELKKDIKNMIRKEFHAGEIQKLDIFMGGRKLGASYHITEPLAIAKIWGYKYVCFNDQVWTVEGEHTGFNIDEI